MHVNNLIFNPGKYTSNTIFRKIQLQNYLYVTNVSMRKTIHKYMRNSWIVNQQATNDIDICNKLKKNIVLKTYNNLTSEIVWFLYCLIQTYI